MTWETIIENALQGISNFVTSFVSIIGSSLNPAAVEGLIAIFAIVLIYRVAQGGVKIPQLKHKDEDDEEYEYVMIRRRK